MGMIKTSDKPPKRLRLPLKSAQDVARFMARCIRSTVKGEGGKAAENRAYKLVNMSSQLLKAIEVASLEQRLSNLEKRAGVDTGTTRGPFGER